LGELLTTTDLAIFFGSLILVMAVGLWAGRKEEDSTDFYLAGKTTRWWGVAGSIFGSNISANHIVGMMGIGFALGFVESHFEITAIAGLLLLCYGFLPVYRKLGVFTLSEYLAKRYNDASRVAYAIIMVTIIVVVMMVPAFYIGSRTLNILMVDQAQIQQVLESTKTASPQKIEIDRDYYIAGILIMAVVTGTYTIIGGLKAVIITDVIQSIMMLGAAFLVCALTFSQPEIGGWLNFFQTDAAEGREAMKMKLYLPSDHPDRPWTGMLSGLMVLHFYYWGTNQFIVQRALAARSDREARIGIITAGFFKLLIPFISIGTGVAAYYLFREKMPGVKLDADTAFPMLMRELVAPIGFGLVGLVAAGMVGAILSSVDSMMNSAATLLTFDIYKRFVHPTASEKTLIWVGRAFIALFVIGSASLTIFIMDPNTQEPFFTYVAKHQSKLVAGLVVAFAMGMWWKGATAWGGFAAIISGIAFSYALPELYPIWFGNNQAVVDLFGPQLNFFHAVFLAALLSGLTHVIVSKLTHSDPEKSKLTWTELGGHEPEALRRLVRTIAWSLVWFAAMAMAMVNGMPPWIAATLAAVWTFGAFAMYAVVSARAKRLALIQEDRFWGGLLAACAVFLLFYFY